MSHQAPLHSLFLRSIEAQAAALICGEAEAVRGVLAEGPEACLRRIHQGVPSNSMPAQKKGWLRPPLTRRC